MLPDLLDGLNLADHVYLAVHDHHLRVEGLGFSLRVGLRVEG